MKEIILKVFRLQDVARSLWRCQIFEGEIILELADSRQAICPRCGHRTRRKHAGGKIRRVFHGAS
jgi:rRNA maturation endonuclease Nob1